MSTHHRPIRTRRARRSATLGLLLCSVLGAAAVAEETVEKPPRLEVLARYPVPDMDDRIMDVQWAGKDSIYIALFDRGVVEVELREGLPELAHLFGTKPGKPNLRLPAIDRFAISDTWIVAAWNRFAWARRDSGGGPAAASVQRTINGMFDFAVDDSTVVLWGRPDEAHWRKAKGGLLWKADLGKGLDTWEVLYENDEAAADPALVRENWTASGSVAFLGGGDIVLAPNAPRVLPTVLRFSSTGKLKETWTAGEIWGDGSEILDDREEARWTDHRPRGGEDYEAFLNNRRIVDAVLGLPEGPAIVVREPDGGAARWRLAVLAPEIRWYEIPVKNVSSAAQFTGDADVEGRIVMVGATRELHEEVRVTENEVLVMRLPLP